MAASGEEHDLSSGVSPLRNGTAFLIALLVSVATHWLLLGYVHPFGGQQSDDDYHYYSFAARLDAEDPRALPAYRLEMAPDRLTDPLSVVQARITFSDVRPYRGWGYALHLLTFRLGLSYPTAALVLFVLQAGLLIYGAQLLAAAVAPPGWVPWWRLAGGLAAAGFLGIESLPSPLLSIPMNMAVALAVAGLGLLIRGRWVPAAGLLVLAVLVHVVAAMLVLFVVGTWLIHDALQTPRARWPGLALRALAVAAVALGVWAATYHGDAFGVGEGGLLERVELAFSKYRLDYLIRGYGWFFPAVLLPAAAGCALLAIRRDPQARLPLACLGALAGAALAFVMVGVGRPHPLHHPIGRLLYLAPLLAVLVALGVGARLAVTASGSRLAWLLAIVCIVTALGNASWQGYRVVQTQFVSRGPVGFGPLYVRLSRLAGEPGLRQTGFVFSRYNFATVLGAAHLYHGRFFWATQYSPERLEQAVATSQRLVYLQGPDDPTIRVRGFCDVAEEGVSLGLRPGMPNGWVVRLVWAARC